MNSKSLFRVILGAIVAAQPNDVFAPYLVMRCADLRGLLRALVNDGKRAGKPDQTLEQVAQIATRLEGAVDG